MSDTEYKCLGCFNVKGDKLEEGNKGVAACWSGKDFVGESLGATTSLTDLFVGAGAAKLASATSFALEDKNSWDYTARYNEYTLATVKVFEYTSSRGDSTFTLLSKDLKDGGKKGELGLPLKSKVKLACVCSKALTTKPDMSKVDFGTAADWTTTRTFWVNLEHIASGHSYGAAIIAGVFGIFAFFF